MIVRPKKRENPYAQIDNRVLCDKRLSWRARGILAYLLSKPTDWKVMTADIVNQGTEGRDAVRAAFKECARLGYARLSPSRRGREWHVFEEPSPENPTLSHALKKPTTEKANVGKSAPTNTESVTKTEAETNARERLSKIFGRKPTTKWNPKEVKALKALLPIDEEEFAMVERYYAKNRKKADNICRRDLFTLLNNWAGEVDRARQWCEKNPLPSERRQAAPRIEREIALPPPEETSPRFLEELADRKRRKQSASNNGATH